MPKKQVTFSSSVAGIQIMNIHEYSASEVSAAWYNDEEMEGITERCFKLLSIMESDPSRNGKVYCTRGLEGHTKLGSISKKKNRSTAIAAVLVEQSKQWKANKVDVRAIADAYKSTASSCQLWAQVVGKRDQRAAEAIYYAILEDIDSASSPTSCSIKSCNLQFPTTESGMPAAERSSPPLRNSLLATAA